MASFESGRLEILTVFSKYPVPYLPLLVWANYKPDQVLESEENDDEVVDEVDDKDNAWEVHSPLLVLLELLRRGDDEGDRGDHHLPRGLNWIRSFPSYVAFKAR